MLSVESCANPVNVLDVGLREQYQKKNKTLWQSEKGCRDVPKATVASTA